MRSNGGRAVAVGAALRWVGNPGTVAAVLVLAFNDHVGKRAWPGVVTGKLSDVAWMLVAPPVLALLLTPLLRLRGDWPAVVGIGGTAVAFALAKSGPAGGEITSWIWSLSGVPSRIKGDPTDLVVLPALLGAWWLWRAGRRPWRGWQALALIAVPGAVAAMVATSAADPGLLLWSDNGRPMLQTSQALWTSADGGHTWTVVRTTVADDLPGDGGPSATQGRCAPDRPLVCYRLATGGSAVEASQDGGHTWTPAFTPTRTEHNDANARGEVGELVVVTLPGGGHGVIVNYHWRGLAVMAADGRWTERSQPAILPEQWDWTPARALPVAAAVAWSVVVAGLSVRMVRTAPARRRLTLGLLLVLRQAAVLGAVYLITRLCGLNAVWFMPGWLPAAVLAVWAFPLALQLWPREREELGWACSYAPLIAITAVAALAVMPPYMLQSLGGGPGAWSLASTAAMFVALVGTVCGGGAGMASALPPAPVHHPGPYPF
ncbi:hypothetical protein ACGFX4_11840 [Kitasatospora sp. NPDC048365]|uniref:hypothetical protein n=1 Tax=Kitasatospora sp. NPDC048365 TaxID=3364050 RepID=UPI00371ACB6D